MQVQENIRNSYQIFNEETRDAVQEYSVEVTREIKELATRLIHQRREALKNGVKKKITRRFCHHPRNICVTTLTPPPKDIMRIFKERLTVGGFLKSVDYLSLAKTAGISILVLGGTAYLTPLVFGSSTYKDLIIKMFDPTEYPVTIQECVVPGTQLGSCIVSVPKVVLTSNLLSFGIPIVAISTLTTALVGYAVINEICNKYEQTMSLQRTFFTSYFRWKVDEIKEIKRKFQIPEPMLNDEVLTQTQNICEISNNVLVFPMRTPNNHVFEYDVIEEHLVNHHTCPITGIELNSDQLTIDEETFKRIRLRVEELAVRIVIAEPNDETENVLIY